MKYLRALYSCVVFLLFGNLPGPIGIRLRRFFYRFLLGSMGANVNIGTGVKLVNPRYIRLGDDVWLDDYSILVGGKVSEGKRRFYRKESAGSPATEGFINIGKGVHLSPFSLIQGHGGVDIGDYCTIGSGAKIYSLSHHYKTMGESPVEGLVCKYTSMAPPEEQCLIMGPVIVECNTAVLPNCVLLSGAFLSEGSWLLVGSVLNQKIPPYKIAGGNPAKVLKDRPTG